MAEKENSLQIIKELNYTHIYDFNIFNDYFINNATNYFLDYNIKMYNDIKLEGWGWNTLTTDNMSNNWNIKMSTTIIQEYEKLILFKDINKDLYKTNFQIEKDKYIELLKSAAVRWKDNKYEPTKEFFLMIIDKLMENYNIVVDLSKDYYDEIKLVKYETPVSMLLGNNDNPIQTFSKYYKLVIVDDLDVDLYVDLKSNSNNKIVHNGTYYDVNKRYLKLLKEGEHNLYIDWSGRDNNPSLEYKITIFEEYIVNLNSFLDYINPNGATSQVFKYLITSDEYNGLNNKFNGLKIKLVNTSNNLSIINDPVMYLLSPLYTITMEI